MIKIAAPMFILRSEANKNVFSVLERLGALGFDGVEFLGFFGTPPKELRKKANECNLEVVGNHVDTVEFIKHPEKVIAENVELGCSYVSITWPDRSVKYGDKTFSDIIKQLNRVNENCKDSGIHILYHNHKFEFEGESNMLDAVLDNCPLLEFEPDIGWMTAGGVNPEDYLLKYNKRCRVLHFKDVLIEGETGKDSAFVFRPTGYGSVNYPGLMKACFQCSPEWLVADHDCAYERDIYSDLKLSLDYIRNLLELDL